MKRKKLKRAKEKDDGRSLNTHTHRLGVWSGRRGRKRKRKLEKRKVAMSMEPLFTSWPDTKQTETSGSGTEFIVWLSE